MKTPHHFNCILLVLCVTNVFWGIDVIIIYRFYVYLSVICDQSRSTIGEGRGCHKFVNGFGGDGTKIAPPEDIFDQPLGEMS